MKKLLSFEVPESADGYRELSIADLDKLHTLAATAAGPIREKGADEVTDEDVTTLQELASVAINVRAAKQHFAAKREEFTAAASAFDADEAKADDKPAEQAPAEEKPAEPETVTAAAKGKAPRVGDIDKDTPGEVVPVTAEAERYGRLMPAGDVAGVTEFASMMDVAKVVEQRMTSYAGRQGGYSKNGVAVWKREFPENLTQRGHGDDEELLDFAAMESRLPGGNLLDSVALQMKQGASLTAAAGWCAPSQTVYDLFELEASTGTVDLPEIQISRGGLRFTPGPDFASIFAGTGYFHQTEAQVIAATPKTCMVVPCPTFTDVRLEVEGVCITGAILQSRGYPEMVARFIRGAMSVHYHKLNQFVIAQMVAGSTTVDLSPAPVAGSVAADDTSATTILLSTIEMAAVDYKYRHRMPINATLEAVFPYWALAVVRADVSRRTGVMEVNVTDDQILSWFRARGIRPQFVYDWQDSFAGLATGPGGATALSQFPQELEFLMYAAGTFVRGSADVITLDTVYDAANLVLNQFTALFTEEGVLVAKRGHDARRYIVPFCPTGATSATIAMNCSA
jgi:hypothetical protein